MKPTVGRIVHYQGSGTLAGEYKNNTIAAIVTRVSEMEMSDGSIVVGLCIFNPTGLFFNQTVFYSEEPMPGHWSWPPREQS